jgi:mono/diheme cytochrome c family protein
MIVRLLARAVIAALVGAAVAGAAFEARARGQTPPDRAPTFARDVAPIIYTHCTSCHRPGQAAPFSLVSYEDVRRRAQLIAAVTARRYMPPWHAAQAAGFPPFADERRLTDAEIATIGAWVRGGTPAGDLDAAIKAPVFPDGWALGRPDLIVSLPRPVEVPAEGPDQYRNVLVRINLPEDRWIRAIDFDPQGRSVLHHALYFITPADAAVRDDDVLPGVGLGGGRGLLATAQLLRSGSDLGGWVPGTTPRFFPDGIAQPLPGASNLVVQLHLHPSGKPEVVAGDIALYFADTPPERSLMGVQVPPLFGFAAGIDIPPGERRYVVRDEFVLPVGVEAFGARGHAHYLAREMRMTATLPDGSTRGLLFIPDWDFGWQDSYYFKEPQRLPEGTRVQVELIYDNSADNERNPYSPPKRVRWGRESFDEMGSMTLLVAPRTQAEREALQESTTQHFVQQLLRSRLRR